MKGNFGEFSLDLQQEKTGMLKIISESTQGIYAHIDNNNNNILVNDSVGLGHTSQLSLVNVDKRNSDCCVI